MPSIKDLLEKAPLVRIGEGDHVKWALHCGGDGKSRLLAVFSRGGVDLRSSRRNEVVSGMVWNATGLGELFIHGLNAYHPDLMYIDIEMLDGADQVALTVHLMTLYSHEFVARHMRMVQPTAAAVIGCNPEMPSLVRAACYPLMRNAKDKKDIRLLVDRSLWGDVPAHDNFLAWAAAITMLADVKTGWPIEDLQGLREIVAGGVIEHCFNRELIRSDDWCDTVAKLKRLVP